RSLASIAASVPVPIARPRSACARAGASFTPEGRHYLCRVSCGGSVVLVDETTEAVATADLALGRSLPPLVEVGRSEFERAMWSLSVVMVDIDPEHTFEVAAVEDQQPVETLGTDRADRSLRNRVRLRRPHGRLHDPDAFAAEYLVEAAAVFAVAVTKQELHAVV